MRMTKRMHLQANACVHGYYGLTAGCQTGRLTHSDTGQAGMQPSKKPVAARSL
eukprot:CAMPEP_0204107562 /NCGR_PEP_ID=MMETSP0361-20130328/203_1 /ASSEMBLY_ACC=CAM_ASM_000343 /TAXON_ID=268821 /ORGANISM="Scrippsiella Hangoei, Strain SHTV-5" /LENGTH=52 /DNA_ID=CAMNT_0051057057 /DNA_START=299 /DNA_END=454 /DNA_ORIENTATION=+